MEVEAGAADGPQSQPSAAPTKWERTCPRTGWYIRYIFSVRQQAFVASNRSLRQLLQVFSKSEKRCRPPIPGRSCRRLRGGAADRPQSQPSAAPTKWERTCPRTGLFIRHIFSVRQQAFVGKRAYRVVIPPSFKGYLSAPDARAIHFMRRSSTRWANQAVVSLRVIFGLSRTMPGRMARGNGLPAALSASAKTSL